MHTYRIGKLDITPISTPRRLVEVEIVDMTATFFVQELEGQQTRVMR